MPTGCSSSGYRRFPPPLVIVKRCGLGTSSATAVEAAAAVGGDVVVAVMLIAVVGGLPLVACSSLGLCLAVPREATLHPWSAIRQRLSAGILERSR